MTLRPCVFLCFQVTVASCQDSRTSEVCRPSLCQYWSWTGILCWKHGSGAMIISWVMTKAAQHCWWGLLWFHTPEGEVDCRGLGGQSPALFWFVPVFPCLPSIFSEGAFPFQRCSVSCFPDRQVERIWRLHTTSHLVRQVTSAYVADLSQSNTYNLRKWGWKHNSQSVKTNTLFCFVL